VTLPELWAQALSLPVLSVSTPYTMRLNLARLLRTSEAAEAAIISGLRSDIPASAFLSGYQVAMRAVDPTLSPEHWACLCVSEKGLQSLSSMSTLYHDGAVTGRKSHAMLAHAGIDWFYVIARSREGLVCRRISATAAGVEVEPASKNQAVIPELPHHSLVFDLAITDHQYQRGDAHHTINKPFRYHEDVLTLLAFSGWCMRMVGSAPAARSDELVVAVKKLASGYDPEAMGYSVAQLSAFDELLCELMAYAEQLPEKAAEYWKRDRQLLLMGQKARDVIRKKLNS